MSHIPANRLSQHGAYIEELPDAAPIDASGSSAPVSTPPPVDPELPPVTNEIALTTTPQQSAPSDIYSDDKVCKICLRGKWYDIELKSDGQRCPLNKLPQSERDHFLRQLRSSILDTAPRSDFSDIPSMELILNNNTKKLITTSTNKATQEYAFKDQTLDTLCKHINEALESYYVKASPPCRTLKGSSSGGAAASYLLHALAGDIARQNKDLASPIKEALEYLPRGSHATQVPIVSENQSPEAVLLRFANKRPSTSDSPGFHSRNGPQAPEFYTKGNYTYPPVAVVERVSATEWITYIQEAGQWWKCTPDSVEKSPSLPPKSDKCTWYYRKSQLSPQETNKFKSIKNLHSTSKRPTDKWLDHTLMSDFTKHIDGITPLLASDTTTHKWDSADDKEKLLTAIKNAPQGRYAIPFNINKHWEGMILDKSNPDAPKIEFFNSTGRIPSGLQDRLSNEAGVKEFTSVLPEDNGWQNDGWRCGHYVLHFFDERLKKNTSLDTFKAQTSPEAKKKVRQFHSELRDRYTPFTENGGFKNPARSL